MSADRNHSPARRCLYAAVVCAAWAAISVHPLMKYLSPTRATAALVFGLLSILVALLLPDPFDLRRRKLGVAWFVLLFALLAGAFDALYPISLRHTLNRGSDREDALRIELNAVQHHQYPYDARTFLGNPPTPLPGAMLLAAPFYAIHHIAWQNFLWLALFFVFTARWFRYPATALFFLATFLLFAPADLSDFTSGGDYLTNFFYVTIAVALFVAAQHRRLPPAIAAAVFLGITLSSRALYPLILIPLLAYCMQRAPRSRARTLALFAMAPATAAAITLPIFAPHPIPRLFAVLDQNSGKLHFLPAALHPRITLPLAALATAATAFFVRMDRPRLFLIFGLTSAVAIVPAIATFGLRSGYAFFYLSVSSLAFSLWALARYEELEPPPAPIDLEARHPQAEELPQPPESHR